jgi:hypothetical protein
VPDRFQDIVGVGNQGSLLVVADDRHLPVG